MDGGIDCFFSRSIGARDNLVSWAVTCRAIVAAGVGVAFDRIAVNVPMLDLLGDEVGPADSFDLALERDGAGLTKRLTTASAWVPKVRLIEGTTGAERAMAPTPGLGRLLGREDGTEEVLTGGSGIATERAVVEPGRTIPRLAIAAPDTEGSDGFEAEYSAETVDVDPERGFDALPSLLTVLERTAEAAEVTLASVRLIAISFSSVEADRTGAAEVVLMMLETRGCPARAVLSSIALCDAVVVMGSAPAESEIRLLPVIGGKMLVLGLAAGVAITGVVGRASLRRKWLIPLSDFTGDEGGCGSAVHEFEVEEKRLFGCLSSDMLRERLRDPLDDAEAAEAIERADDELGRTGSSSDALVTRSLGRKLCRRKVSSALIIDLTRCRVSVGPKHLWRPTCPPLPVPFPLARDLRSSPLSPTLSSACSSSP